MEARRTVSSEWRGPGPEGARGPRGKSAHDKVLQGVAQRGLRGLAHDFLGRGVLVAGKVRAVRGDRAPMGGPHRRVTSHSSIASVNHLRPHLRCGSPGSGGGVGGGPRVQTEATSCVGFEGLRATQVPRSRQATQATPPQGLCAASPIRLLQPKGGRHMGPSALAGPQFPNQS